ncbi:MAG: hypothetical protein FWH35_00720 [Treponema sp.]|nr:hypothetical protein [Treponema sp.]
MRRPIKNRRFKGKIFLNEDESYVETLRRIKECREKKRGKLDFSKLKIKSVPDEIAGLENLTELDISNTNVKEIPGFIGNIASLKKLSVGSTYSSAHPHDNEELKLPPELGDLGNLQYLFLGYGVPEIPEWVWQLDKLEELCIYNDAIETIPAKIWGLKKLRKLQINCDKITTLPCEMGELPSLSVLYLQCPHLKTLPGSFLNLKAMRDFRFESCNLAAIPGFVYAWIGLKILIINMENTFQGPFTEMKTLPANIGNLKELVYLSFTGTSFTQVPDSLANCPLEYLELEGDYKVLPEAIGKLSKLETLKIVSTKLKELPDTIGNLSALKELNIRSPGLKVPASFGRLTALEELSIATEDIVLPKTFGGLSSLEKLFIDAPDMQSVPASIGGCKNLKLVSLDSDKLARLPESFCELKKLEEIRLDTFALESLPEKFGDLSALKYIDIFSGKLAALPKSMVKFRKINRFSLDAHNLKEIPDWFKKLIYAKEADIQTGKEELSLASQKNSKKNDAGFEELKAMSWQYRNKLLESYTIKQLESLLCTAPHFFLASESDKGLFKAIMLERHCRLKRKFKWTEENKKRISRVSDEFLIAWQEGFEKAKFLLEALYEKEKDSFKDKYTVEIILYPEILQDDDGINHSGRLYDVIADYLNPEFALNMHVEYDPATKDESKFWENIFVCRDLSWNIEGFGDIELKDYYICYALHVLYSHNNWAFEDIPKINSIITEVKLSYDNIQLGTIQCLE